MPVPVPRYEDKVPRGGGSEYVEPAEGGPSREFRRARLISKSRGPKSLWSRKSLESRMGERRGGVGRLSRRSKSRSRSRSALQEFALYEDDGPLLNGGAFRRGVASPRPAKPLPLSSRGGAEDALEGGPTGGTRGGSASDFGPLGTSLEKVPGSALGLKVSLPLGGYPPPKLEGLRSRSR
ncbi:hypothetical protein A1F94_000785 [Pyrenophora tritici-repentis]|uniref:DUF1777 domain containing protein n=1 Tax=Pyrenophora tritici-repentis TaxID=45151 RepID=A0A317AEF0_9PLEO|nr:hypothetical protein PtrV1_01407 [Pyrenophora tritici-repentis]KAF7454146.1 hypothetical protein A1F99_014040 [Pyrenophora tritici-repentis]KAF7577235.1 DUF1777 domain containing protein [Pyrenophora tritici-repentis]KAG9387893.1 hypothetical protein A1F94_000785 [Pyrenophora tritici-repentis]KAI1542603.1 hypothetical protein PtrSN001C_004134 [Pyrenophora tritici-repentis]